MKALRSWIGLLAVFAITLLYPTAMVRADGFEVAFFTLEHDSEASVLDIVHRLYQSDVEIAFSKLQGHDLVIDNSPKSEALIQNYIDERFSLSTADGTAISTRWQGIELDGGTLFVRQQADFHSSFENLVIRNDILIDTHEKQVNMMHANVWDQYFRRDFMAGGAVQRLKRKQ